MQRSAVDFEEFYRGRPVEKIRQSLKDSTITVLTTDGKGVLVYPQDLREETRKKLEKEYGDQLYFRKRMAQVAAVYHVEPYKRSVDDVLAGLMGSTTKRAKPTRPKPQDKRVWAGIVDDSERIIGTVFAEALRRDPKQQTDWVAVVDGAEHQIKVITDQARAWEVNVTIVCDIIHAIEYVWKAAKMLYAHERRRRKWVRAHVDRLLRGKVSQVAAGIRRAKTKRGRKLKKAERKKIDEAADYLLNHKYYMRYDQYLKAGYPSGVIEAAVRHLVNDRHHRCPLEAEIGRGSPENARAENIRRFRGILGVPRASGTETEPSCKICEQKTAHNVAAPDLGSRTSTPTTSGATSGRMTSEASGKRSRTPARLDI